MVGKWHDITSLPSVERVQRAFTNRRPRHCLRVLKNPHPAATTPRAERCQPTAQAIYANDEFPVGSGCATRIARIKYATPIITNPLATLASSIRNYRYLDALVSVAVVNQTTIISESIRGSLTGTCVLSPDSESSLAGKESAHCAILQKRVHLARVSKVEEGNAVAVDHHRPHFLP